VKREKESKAVTGKQGDAQAGKHEGRSQEKAAKW